MTFTFWSFCTRKGTCGETGCLASGRSRRTENPRSLRPSIRCQEPVEDGKGAVRKCNGFEDPVTRACAVFVALAVSAALFPFVAPAAAAGPNILLILADDLAFSDLGCYGGEIATPNLDRLAKDGLRFRQFYNCTRCCPSRASLLTGLYPHQAGVGDMTADTGQPGYRGFPQPNAV